GGGTYQEGQTCMVEATTNVGYNFINWTENGVEVSASASYTFTVTANRTLV
ncbi:InlB B-repeat-containing protein, partial [Klebsiella pneumoniae]|uniref:InlB B-repeat-containing protein n=1 Tax=Klebsiella pneumoniae TaxID=573 RepID=UPI0034D96934